MVIAEGASTIENFEFNLVMLLDKNFSIIEEIIPFTINTSTIHYNYENLFKLNHIYYSEELGKDIIIGTYNLGYDGYLINLLIGKKGIIKKIPLFGIHGC